MKPFSTKIYGTPKSATQRAQEWVNQNAQGPVCVKVCPNYGAVISTITILTCTPKGVQ